MDKELRERIRADVDGYLREQTADIEVEDYSYEALDISEEAIERFKDESYEGILEMGLG